MVQPIDMGSSPWLAALGLSDLPPVLSEFQSAEDPDQATAQTIEHMCALVQKSISDPVVQRAAAMVLARWATKDAGMIPWGTFWFTKHKLSFVHHQKFLSGWLKKADALQFLFAPDYVLRMKRPAGDCAVYSMLVCALLKCLGVDYEFITVAADPEDPSLYTHVFCRAVLPDGTRIPLDASHGDFPGWQVPQSRRFRTQVWDENGRQVEDAGSRFEGLHAYVRRGNRGRWGVGQLDDEGNPITPVSGGASSSIDTIVDPLTGNVYNTAGQLVQLGASGSSSAFGSATSPASAPSGLTPAQTNALIAGGSAAVAQGLNLVGQIVAPTTTITRGPSGQLMISTPASAAGANALAAATGGTTASSLLGSGSSSEILLLGGLALAAFLVMKMVSK